MGEKVQKTADSIKAAAAMLGCNPSQLQAAKAAGCPAFRSGRVDIEEMREWLKANPPDPEDMSKQALECRRLLAQCLTLEHRLEVEKRKVIPIAEVRSDITRIAGVVRTQLNALQAEAHKWEGMRAADITDAVAAYCEQMVATFHDQAGTLYE